MQQLELLHALPSTMVRMRMIHTQRVDNDLQVPDPSPSGLGSLGLWLDEIRCKKSITCSEPTMVDTDSRHHRGCDKVVLAQSISTSAMPTNMLAVCRSGPVRSMHRLELF